MTKVYLYDKKKCIHEALRVAWKPNFMNSLMDLIEFNLYVLFKFIVVF